MRSSGFNPLPARRPGATLNRLSGAKQIRVSILSQPEGRELHHRYKIAQEYGLVSILSQPEGRELLSKTSNSCRCYTFQSSPSPKAGSYDYFGVSEPIITSFQSSPSPKAGSYVGFFSRFPLSTVFQSSPSPKAGSYENRLCYFAATDMFQSSPSPKAGSYVLIAGMKEQTLRFQSSPSPKAGSYLCKEFNIRETVAVSILSQPEGRELRRAEWTDYRMWQFQSSPSPKAGSYA